MAEEKFVPNASVGSSKESAFKKPEPSRRNFLSWLSLGWVAYIGVTGGFFTMIVRFLFPNVLFEPPQTFKIGFPDDFQKTPWISSLKNNTMLGSLETKNQFCTFYCLYTLRLYA